jgi:hypothetical protein
MRLRFQQIQLDTKPCRMVSTIARQVGSAYVSGHYAAGRSLERVHNVFRSAGEANKRRFIYSAFAATHTLTLPQTCFTATHRLRCEVAAAECANVFLK